MNPIKPLILFAILLFLSCNSKPEFSPLENYEDGLKEAKQESKPIFLYFTGFGCVGYDEFVQDLIHSEEIYDCLAQNFVTIQLFVDDRTKLDKKDSLFLLNYPFPDSCEYKISKFKNKGNINAFIEEYRFNRQNQPLYVILSPTEQILVKPFEYTSRDTIFFLNKLKEGIQKYNSLNDKNL